MSQNECEIYCTKYLLIVLNSQRGLNTGKPNVLPHASHINIKKKHKMSQAAERFDIKLWPVFTRIEFVEHEPFPGIF